MDGATRKHRFCVPWALSTHYVVDKTDFEWRAPVAAITSMKIADRRSTEAAGPYLLQLFEAAVPDGQ
jgi:hypothetical protein